MKIIRRIGIAYSIPKATNTHSQYVIFIAFPTATMVARTRLNVTFIRTLFCLVIAEMECVYWAVRTECLTLRRLMSYIYGAPILDVSRSHTTTQHSR